MSEKFNIIVTTVTGMRFELEVEKKNSIDDVKVMIAKAVEDNAPLRTKLAGMELAQLVADAQRLGRNVGKKAKKEAREAEDLAADWEEED